MGGLFLVSKSSPIDHDRILQTSRRQFEFSGFGAPSTIDVDQYLIDHYGKYGARSRDFIQFQAGDFILSVGTFIYKGRTGDAALRQFWSQPVPANELDETHGNFFLLLRKHGQMQLLRDRLGSYEIFVTPLCRSLSTSFIAAAAAAPHRTIRTGEVYEYVFNGVSLGKATPVAEVDRLDLTEQVRFDRDLSILRTEPVVCPEEQKDSFPNLVKQNLEGLYKYTSELVGLFSSNINVALSGGYDSRLLLALFRHSGVTPKLFVYGDDASQDVQAAKRITAAEGIPINHVNKSRLTSISADQFEDVVRTNFFREDALPWGGIFVNGAELLARQQRNADGALHVNGGGGEVFRNFFYLPDRPISTRDLVWTFFSQYDPAYCTGDFEAKTYEDRISQKMTGLLGLRDDQLTRRQVDTLYPYFRCRSWFGRENSINSRWGPSVLPFFDFDIVQKALRIPVRFKHFGNFEAAMIRSADLPLARHVSNYGHNFLRNAPASAVYFDLLSYLRPPWLRRYTFRTKARLLRNGARPTLLSSEFLSRALDLTFPYMSKYFRMEKAIPNDLFARICTLEYLFHMLDAQ